jgi:hypothetical protein
VYNGVACFGEDLSNEHRLRQLELKWLIKTYATTTNKAKFFNPFLQTGRNTKLNNKLKTESQKLTELGNRSRKFKMRAKYLIY